MRAITRRSLAAAFTASALLVVGGAEAATFLGFKADTFCCGGASGIRLEWSSDFGIDYSMKSDNDPGLFVPNQPLSPGPVWAFGSVEAGRSVEMQLFRDLGGGISLGAHGLIEIGAAGPVGLGTVHRMHHTMLLANSSSQYGVGASGDLHGDFFFSGVSAASPLFWGIEWTLTLSRAPSDPAPNATALLGIDDQPATGPLPNQPFGPPRTLTGSVFGMNDDGSFRLTSLSDLAFAGAGVLDWDIRIAFAEQAFTDIPDPPTGVPSPGTLALLGSSLLALGWARHRWQV